MLDARERDGYHTLNVKRVFAGILEPYLLLIPLGYTSG